LRNVNSGSHYIVGDKLTVADLENANTIFTYLKNEKAQLSVKHQEVLAKYGSLEKYADTLKEELEEYFSSRPQRPF
jgi:DnaJ-domain-containing protein 1